MLVLQPKRGWSIIMLHLQFWLMDRKSKQKSLSHGTAPLKLIFIFNSDTYSKYWYIVVGVTISFKGLLRGQSIINYFKFVILAV